MLCAALLPGIEAMQARHLAMLLRALVHPILTAPLGVAFEPARWAHLAHALLPPLFSTLVARLQQGGDALAASGLGPAASASSNGSALGGGGGGGGGSGGGIFGGGGGSGGGGFGGGGFGGGGGAAGGGKAARGDADEVVVEVMQHAFRQSRAAPRRPGGDSTALRWCHHDGGRPKWWLLTTAASDGWRLPALRVRSWEGWEDAHAASPMPPALQPEAARPRRPL